MPNSPDRAFRVWAVLAEMYGTKLLNAYGDKPGPMWRRVIGELTDVQIRAGLDALMRSGSAFAPTLPEFRAACVPVISEDSIQMLAYELIPSFDRATMRPDQLHHVARSNLARARALLNGSAEPSSRESNVMARALGSSTAMVTQ